MTIYYIPIIDQGCTGTTVCTRVSENVTTCKCVVDPETSLIMFIILVGVVVFLLGITWWIGWGSAWWSKWRWNWRHRK